MKAQRRHELQTNSLAKFLENLPIALRLYADRILLVIVISVVGGIGSYSEAIFGEVRDAMSTAVASS